MMSTKRIEQLRDQLTWLQSRHDSRLLFTDPAAGRAGRVSSPSVKHAGAWPCLGVGQARRARQSFLI
jgi:hypothetical protein